MKHLVAAIVTKFPEALENTSHLLKAYAMPPMQRLVSTLVNELDLLPHQ
jgi:hypothetical protein